MLVLSRKAGEQIVIGDNVTVVVSRVSGNRVSIGIEAPDDVKIIRGELKRIRDEFQDVEPPQVAGSVCAPLETDSLALTPRVAR